MKYEGEIYGPNWLCRMPSEIQKLREGQTIVIGVDSYALCFKCYKVVKVNKFLFGSSHVCEVAKICDFFLGTYVIRNINEEYIEGNQLSIGSNSELRINPTLRRLTHESYYEEICGKSVSEYRFDGFDVEMRLIEKSWGVGIIDTYEVKDNVILETAIGINELKSEINWHKLYSLKVKYFILSKHPTLFKEGELISFYRKEFERLESAKYYITYIAKQNGFVVKTTEHGIVLDVSEDFVSSDEEEKRVHELRSKICFEAGVMEGENYCIDDELKFLSDMLNSRR